VKLFPDRSMITPFALYLVLGKQRKTKMHTATSGKIYSHELRVLSVSALQIGAHIQCLYEQVCSPTKVQQ
jgi:hypothetical protein